MVDSLETTARAAILGWIESIGLIPEPTVIQVGPPPTRDESPGLPTLEVSFGAEEWTRSQKSVAGSLGDRIIWDFGELAVETTILWRAGSEADAEAFRAQFRTAFLLATAEGDTDASSLKLPATYFGAVEDGVELMLSPPNHFVDAKGRETGTVDYYVLAHTALVTMPLLALEPEPGTGVMDVLVEGGQADIDPFDMNDRTDPEGGA